MEQHEEYHSTVQNTRHSLPKKVCSEETQVGSVNTVLTCANNSGPPQCAKVPTGTPGRCRAGTHSRLEPGRELSSADSADLAEHAASISN